MLLSLLPCCALAQDTESVWAPSQQEKLANDLLYAEEHRFAEAMVVAEVLGPSRASEAVRSALIERLEELNRAYDAAVEALGEEVGLNDVFSAELFMDFADVVASYEDPRSIAALVHSGRYASSHLVPRTIASFGDAAVPFILEALAELRPRDFGFGTPLYALAEMVEDGGVNELSDESLSRIAEVSREGLKSNNGRFLRYSVVLAGALQQPELLREVELIWEDRGIMVGRGIDSYSQRKILEAAAEALGRTPSP